MTGIDTLPINFSSPKRKPRGTDVAIVGIRASCQPIPVLMIVAPAADRLGQLHNLFMGGSIGDQINHRQAINNEIVPTAVRARRTISTGNRIRFSYEPPQRSVRLFVGHRIG